jgi:hypothetical protein
MGNRVVSVITYEHVNEHNMRAAKHLVSSGNASVYLRVTHMVEESVE